MPFNRRDLIRAGGGAFALAHVPRLFAQGWPQQAVRLVVPFTAGSATDIVARTLAQELEKGLRQPVVIDNKPGAGGTVGASQVAAGAGDGYTVLVHSAGHVANAALYPALRYDTLRDFTPVTMLATLPNVLVIGPAKQFSSVQDLVAKAKAQPGKFTYGTAGNGSATHMNAEKFRTAVGIDAVHVPYKGTPEAITEVIAGRIDWFFAPLISAMPLIKDGKLVPLAVGSARRSPALPTIPTTLEVGYANSDYTFWIGSFVSSKTPADIVARLHAEIVRALASDPVKERFERLGAEPSPMAQAAFAQLVAAETAASAELIRRVGMKVE